MILTIIFSVANIIEVKTLKKFLSDNRKFITAFLGLYIAYTIGFNQGLENNGHSGNWIPFIAGTKTEASIPKSTSSSQESFSSAEYDQAPTIEPSANPEAEDKKTESEVSTQNNKIAEPTSPTPAPSSTPHPSISPSPNPSTHSTIKTINASGKYAYMGQDVTYTLAFKNNGGFVSGTVGGFCSGVIDGNFEGRDGGALTGTVKGTCGSGFFSKKLDAVVKGNAFLYRGFINLTVSGEIPYVEGPQTFSLTFEP